MVIRAGFRSADVKRLVLLALVACKSSAPAGPASIGNQAAPSPTETAPVTNVCRVAGIAVDVGTGERFIGATIVVSGGPEDEGVAITDENGSFSVNAHGGDTKITVYYNDGTGEAPLQPLLCGQRIRIAMNQNSTSGAVQAAQITIVGVEAF